MDAADLYGFRNNLQRVFVTLLDGLWHGASELQTVGGQNFGARVRELREARCGGLTIECRKDPHKPASQYRLVASSLSEATKEMLLGGKIPPRQRGSKMCPACDGTGKVPMAFQYDPTPSKPIDTTRWNAVFDMLAG